MPLKCWYEPQKFSDHRIDAALSILREGRGNGEVNLNCFKIKESFRGEYFEAATSGEQALDDLVRHFFSAAEVLKETALDQVTNLETLPTYSTLDVFEFEGSILSRLSFGGAYGPPEDLSLVQARTLAQDFIDALFDLTSPQFSATIFRIDDPTPRSDDYVTEAFAYLALAHQKLLLWYLEGMDFD